LVEQYSDTRLTQRPLGGGAAISLDNGWEIVRAGEARPAATLLSVFTPSVTSPGDFGIVIVGFVLLTVWRAPPLVVVAVSALGGIGLALAGP
jgi:hypothetical protein